MNYIENLKKLINKTNQYTNQLLHNPKYKDLLEFINNWSNKLDDEFYTLKTKIFWVLNDIHEFPRCKTCGREITNKNVFRLTQPEIYNYCSAKCIHNNEDVKRHKKELLMKKYGIDNVFKLDSTKEKSKTTLIKKYGVDHYSKCDCWREQIKNTSIKHYGVEHPQKCKDIREQSKQTCLKKYGVEFAFQSENVKVKSYKTRIEKYGSFYNDGMLKKRELTNLKKYGKKHYTQTEQFKKQSVQTCLKKYGVVNAGSTYQSISKARRRYFYDNIYFSSVPEIAYYIWLKDNDIKFEYQPKSKVIDYVDCKGVWHKYYPDFWIIETNEIHEIKGLHNFKNFDKNEVMVWYRHPEKNYIAEAKQKCMIDNNVKIITNDDYKKYLDYCKTKFLSSTWYKRYKRNDR